MAAQVLAYRTGPMDNNTLVVADTLAGVCAVVDPSYESAPVQREIDERGWRVVMVINTHTHFDHVVENRWFTQHNQAPLVMHPDAVPMLNRLAEQCAMFGVPPPEASTPDRLVTHGEILEIGSVQLEVRDTPGHAPGHIALVGDGFAVVGDAVFRGSIGRTDFPSCSLSLLLERIHSQILSLPDETVLYPGHGPKTTVGEERQNNPYLQEHTTT
jgi:glyoxylase-like metal-dependent hydrolase (beta-lactamase superfamily II)